MASFISSLLRPSSQPLPQPIPQANATSSNSNGSPNTIYATSEKSEKIDPLQLWESLYNDGYCILPGKEKTRN